MMNSKQDQARLDYEAGMKYKDIAAKYDVSINTVKSWKTRNGWTRGAPTSKKGAHKTKEGAPNKSVQLVQQSDLSDKRKRFAMLYLQSFNATKAYMQAYGVSYQSAWANAWRLMADDGVRQLIDDLKAEHAAQLDVTAMDILQDLAKQAKADIGDYLDYATEEHLVYKKDDNGEPQVVIDPETGRPKTYKFDRVDFRQQTQVDTSIIKSVGIEKGQIKLELYDKQHAMDLLLKNMPKSTEINEAAVEKAKADARKAKAEAKISEHKADVLEDNSKSTEEQLAQYMSKLGDAVDGTERPVHGETDSGSSDDEKS